MVSQYLDLSIVIVSWNTCDILATCLETVERELQAWTSSQVETYVVDNGSTDGSQAMIKSRFPWVKLMENSDNVGFGRANNQAMSKALGHYVLLLNSDTEVLPGALTTLMGFMAAHPDAGVAGPLLLNADKTLQLSCDPEPTLARELWRLLHLDKVTHYGVYDQQAWPRDQHRTTDTIKGACMLIRQEVLDQVGLFDEDFFIYSEEVDLCTRIRRAGWKIYWVPQAEIIHHGAQSTRLVAAEMFQHLYKYKLLYFRKNHGLLSAQLYKMILGIGALARVATVPVAVRFGHPEKRRERKQLAANYRQLLLSLVQM